ncbi:MFS transporter [uncultured Desulfobacter sp.]|uniref:MFS transporter n=1 Tax=uncultured Desulfobacter sp. TaxID=240139 RepID=UPI002AA62AC2|nr:MFS transporter [uncultured Desulfobacter sp.]
MTKNFGTCSQYPAEFEDKAGNTKHPPPSLMSSPAGKKILFHSIILLIVALLFNALFNFTTLEKLSKEALALKYHIVGTDLRREIQQARSYDMPLSDVPGMTDRLSWAKSQLSALTINSTKQHVPTHQASVSHFEIRVCRPDGYILFTTEQHPLTDRLPFPLEAVADEKGEKESFLGKNEVISKGDLLFLHLPIENFQKQWIGSVLVSFTKGGERTSAGINIKRQIRIGAILFFIGSVALLWVLAKLLRNCPADLKFHRKRITWSMFYVISPIIIVFSGLNTYTASKQYVDIAKNQVEMALKFTKNNIEKYINMGLPLSDSVKADGRFDELVNAYSIIDSILVLDSEKNWIFAASKKNHRTFSFANVSWVKAFLKKIYYLNKLHELKLTDKNNASLGTVTIRISKAEFLREASNLILNAVTVIAVSILFLVELLVFLFHFIDTPVSQENNTKGVHFGLIRPVTFLFLFGMDLCMSFIPLHMEKIYTPMWKFSKDTVMGLPISIEFCFVGIAIFLSGFWNDRRGWHEPFLVGLFLAGSGTLYSWLAPNVIHFIISRGLVGIGYGLTLLAAQGFVIAFTKQKNRARGFAQFLSGLYAGSICGGATGALLAEKIGYGGVFFIGAVILYISILYPLTFMKKAMVRPTDNKKPSPQTPSAPKNSPDKKVIFDFFSNRIVLSLIFLSSLPAAFAAVGFLHYFSPVYLNRIGTSQGTIGRELMIYGFSLVYLGPIIAKFVDRFDNKRNYIFVGCLLGSLAFLMFYFFEGLIAVTCAIFLLGLSNSFIIASQSTYLLRLKVTYAFGEGKAIGIFRAVSRLGQALGPIIFSGLFLSENIRMSITHLGLIYLMTALLFFLFTIKDRKYYERFL